MQPSRRRIATAGLAIAAGLLAAAPPLAQAQALAQAMSADDRLAVRTTIEQQLQALAAGDAVLAFSFAAPSIRSQFGDAASFITMVRQGYPMVIRPASTAFFEPERRDGYVLQVVQLRDAAGQAWLATYQLAQIDSLPGRPWRIQGVVVVPDAGKSST